jgi:hypothetical protein
MECFWGFIKFGAKGPFVSDKSPKVAHSHTKGPCTRWWVESSLTIQECPHPWALSIIKHKARLNGHKSQGTGGQGSYFLHLFLEGGRDLTPTYRCEISPSLKE